MAKSEEEKSTTKKVRRRNYNKQGIWRVDIKEKKTRELTKPL